MKTFANSFSKLELLKEPDDVGGNAEAGSSNPVIKPKLRT